MAMTERDEVGGKPQPSIKSTQRAFVTAGAKVLAISKESFQNWIILNT